MDFIVKNDFGIFPYLEIRSRDISKKIFMFSVLMYGIKEIDIETNIKKWKENISKSKLFKTQNHSKQTGINKFKETVGTVEELEILVLKYIEEFKRVML